MKYSYYVIALLCVFIAILLFKKPDCETLPPVTITYTDTVYMDNMPAVNTIMYKPAKASNCDSFKTQLFISNFKIERVKHFLNIVDRSPSQIKYLKGWVRRAIE